MKKHQKNHGAWSAVYDLTKQVYFLGKGIKSLGSWMAEIHSEIVEIKKSVKKTEKKKPFLLCAVPKPCNGEFYKDCSLEDYRDKVNEEVEEMMDAYIMWQQTGSEADRHQFLRECTDSIVAITSFMDKAGAGFHERQQVLCEVNRSNEIRDGGKRIKKGA